MNKFGKLALVMSTLAPVLGAFGVHSISHGEFTAFYCYFAAAIGMILLTWLIVRECRKKIAIETLSTKEVRSMDKESLSFLLVYLLPLLAKDVGQYTKDFATVIYVFAAIALVVSHGNLVTFNPILALLGWHFYEVKSGDGMVCTLVSKQIIRKQEADFQVLEIYPFFYMEQLS